LKTDKGLGVSDRSERGPLWLPLLWLLVVAVLGWHQWQFWQSPRLDSDVFALLPQDEQQPAAQRAMKQLAEQGERRVVVMLGGADWERVRQAAQRFDHALQAQQAGLQPVQDVVPSDQVMSFYAPWRDVLLTDAQRAFLPLADASALAAQALGRLHGFSTGQPTTWQADPLGLWSSWWAERGGLTAARPRDGLLWVKESGAGREWAVLLYETQGSAFRFDGQRRWADALVHAESAARGDLGAGLTVLAAGVPLHAEAGAAQGNQEMNTIGWGSLLAVIALVLATFRAAGPMLLIAVSLVIGCAAGLSATVLVFGQVHLLTLVFGASLVGVAEDFGIHYFASRLGTPDQPRWALMRHLLPGLLLALATSVLGYLVLAVVPFPGLRQMALFSAVGLTAAFATAVCWFPWLDRGQLQDGRFAQSIASSLGHWPVLTRARLWIALVILAIVCAVGLARLQVNDDLRQLQSSPPALMRAQMAVGRLLQMPSPAQFFLVQGRTEDDVLSREEALKQALTSWQAQAPQPGGPIGVSAVSDWVPSRQRQDDNHALTQARETAVLQAVGSVVGEDLRRPAFATQALTVSQWLASPASSGLRAQWLGAQDEGFASVVLIRGLSQQTQAQALRELAPTLAGVQWVDRPNDISELMGRFRVTMTWLLGLGHGLVLLTLYLRFGRAAWRAWLPCALGSLVCVAVLGLLGEPFQLFNLLALMLLLGMGVDYGIFLLEHPGEQQAHAWLAVLLGAISTGLSFGLLALSSTPALRAFGLTLLIGLTLVCLLAPTMRLIHQTDKTERGNS
jgi:predicted exporter